MTVLFFTCTTCIVYQYFKEIAAFVSKAGAKVKALFLTTKLFRDVYKRQALSHASPCGALSRPLIYSKDVALYMMSKMTTSGATGYFVEYAGSAIRNLTMEGRLTPVSYTHLESNLIVWSVLRNNPIVRVNILPRKSAKLNL